MNLVEALKSANRKEVEIDGVTLYFKKLNWKELVEFQTFASNAEAKDEDNSTVMISEYVLMKHVTDEEGNPVIKKGEVKSLPVSFCIELVETFMESLRSGKQEAKKK